MSDKTSTPAVESPAGESTDEKNVSVQTRIPASLHAKLDDHAWNTRRRLPAVIAQAIREYAEKHGL